MSNHTILAHTRGYENKKTAAKTPTGGTVGSCGLGALACQQNTAAVIEISVYRQRIARQQCGVGR